ncbi:MAG: hypothetical protein MR303_06245 [Emergencia sp.]|nr:hypothetical protein [Emergencia sp.]
MGNINDKVVEERNAKIKRSGNRLLVSIFILFIGGYFFFFTSNFWMPPAYEDIQVTKIGSSVEKNDRKVTLLSWTWDQNTAKQEIILDITNGSADGVDTYDFEAVDINKGQMNVEVICQAPDFVVLCIEDVPSRWSEISLRIKLPEEVDPEEVAFDTIRLYTSKEAIGKMEVKEGMDEAAYRKRACEIRISDYNAQIDQHLADIESLQTTVANAKKRINELEKEQAYQTESEQADTLAMISSLQSEVSTAESEQENAKREIRQLQEQIKLQEKLKSTY